MPKAPKTANHCLLPSTRNPVFTLNVSLIFSQVVIWRMTCRVPHRWRRYLRVQQTIKTRYPCASSNPGHHVPHILGVDPVVRFCLGWSARYTSASRRLCRALHRVYRSWQSSHVTFFGQRLRPLHQRMQDAAYRVQALRQ
jgi:hypothetical protein